ncbi:MAG: right-handed parallel beta-helix repeat-containing protein [bacterium]
MRIRKQANENIVGNEKVEEAPEERNIISGNTRAGVLIEDAQKNLVGGNYIGTNKDGSVKLPNQDGVVLRGRAQFNLIGVREVSSFNYSGSRNLIAGNRDDGVEISGFDTDQNYVMGNFIGTNDNPDIDLSNRVGVFIHNGAYANQIGGTTFREDNVISGHPHTGVIIQDEGTTNNQIRGNKIGTDWSGKGKIPNRWGVLITQSAKSNIIEKNIISGNVFFGVFLSGRGTNDNKIWGNIVGKISTSLLDLANKQGIYIHALADGNIIGGEGAKANIIAGNDEKGVWLHQVRDNVVTGNFIGTDRAGNELGNDIGVFVQNSAKNTVSSNKIWYNCTAVKLAGSWQNQILNNDEHESWCLFTGLHVSNSSPMVIGNTFRNGAGDAILSEQGSSPVIQKNNFISSGGFAINNQDAGVTLSATGNWFGDASGPGGSGPGSGDEVNGQVDFANWRATAVSLTVAAATDTAYLGNGQSDSVMCFFQNWQNLSDVLNVTVTDSLGWLYGATAYSLTLRDSLGADSTVSVAVPGDAKVGTINKIKIRAVSQSNPAISDADSFLVMVYNRFLAQMEISPA